MIDPITMALIGGAVGGLLDSKKPLRGAALGAAGGYMAPGLLSAAAGAGSSAAAPGLLSGAQTAGTYGTALGGQQTAMLAAQDAAFGGSAAVQGVNPLMATAKGAGGMVKPIGQAAMTVNAVNSMFPKDQPLPPVTTPAPQFGQPGNQNLTSLVSMNANRAAQMEQEKAARAQRRNSLIGGVGYGRFA